MAKESTFVVLTRVQGEMTANVLKTHLESEGIPVLLQYESVGKVFGVMVDGLGEVSLLVPRQSLEEARGIIGQTDDNA
jgi:hypothetical protein